jgi:glucan phosphoethanolaminetransferase (alkaline phosphatase superfamily)
MCYLFGQHSKGICKIKDKLKGDLGMVFGLALVVLSTAGIIFGVIKKHKVITTLSIILMIVVATVWSYFYFFPY